MEIVDQAGHQLTIIGKIGFGRIADVFKVYDHQTDRTLALKVFRCYADDSVATAAALQREAFAAKNMAAYAQRPDYSLCLPLTALTAVHQQQLFPALLLPLIDGLTLADWLLQHPDMSRRIAALYRILLAIAAIHDRGFAHNDLSLGNIMVNDASVTVLDFDRAEPCDLMKSSLPKVAPGAFYASDAVGQSSDLRAFAILAYLILDGSHPYVDKVLPLLQRRWQGPNPFQRPPRPLTRATENSDTTLVRFNNWLQAPLLQDESISADTMLRTWPVTKTFATTPNAPTQSPRQPETTNE